MCPETDTWLHGVFDFIKSEVAEAHTTLREIQLYVVSICSECVRKCKRD